VSTLKSSAENLTLNADGSGNDIKFQSNAVEKGSLTDGGVWIGSTFEPTGDTAASDNAAIGYTAAEGLILTGQGSTNDVTIKNDADATVLEVATGTKNLELTDGNLIIGTAGKGIDFSATSDSTGMTSELLADFEEGNFTPVFVGSSGSVGSYNTGEHEASYQKVGNWVHVVFTITLSNKGSWGGEVRFTALPFIPDGTWHASGDCNFSEVNYSGGSVGNCSVYTTNGVNYWRVFLMQDNDVSTLVQVSDVDNATRFSGSFSYTDER